MKVIYHCYGGTHSSVTAACIHLDLLPRDRLPGYRELTGQKLFDRRDVQDIGRIILMGRDFLGNEVYVVGRRSRPKLLCHVTEGLMQLLGMHRNSLILVDVSSFVNSSMRTGGFMSRRMGLIWPGRHIVAWGTLRNYWRLVEVVEKVFNKITHAPDPNRSGIIQIIRPGAAY